MANRFLDLDGSQQIRENYNQISEGFDGVEAELDAAVENAEGIQAEVTEHKDSSAAHAAEHITYAGPVSSAANMKEAVDSVKQQLDTAVMAGDSGPAAAQAAIDADGVEHPSLKDRIDTDVIKLNEQLADTENQLGTQLLDINRSRFYRLMVAANANGLKVTFVGDSLTEGTANGGHGWFEPLAARFPNAVFVNKGVGANGTVDVVNRLANITATNAYLYVLAVGTNDVRYQEPAKGAITASGYATNIQTIVTAFKAAGGEVVVIGPWPAFTGDYTSVLGGEDRDRLIEQYADAAEIYCNANDVPFIRASVILKSIINPYNKNNFLGDYIHPNSTVGNKLYSDVVLFGNRNVRQYGYAQAATVATYVYKLVIFNYCELTRFSINSAVVASWSNVINSGHDNVSAIIGASGDSYVFKPRSASDLPIIITFSTNTKLEFIRQRTVDNATLGVTDYALYMSTDKQSILDFNHPSWTLLKSGSMNYYTKELVQLDRDITSLITLSSNWSYRSGKTSRAYVRNNVVYLDLQLKKSSAWTSNEQMCALPGYFAPGRSEDNQTVTDKAITALDAGSTSRFTTLLIQGDNASLSANVRVGWRDTNTSSDDVVFINMSYPL